MNQQAPALPFTGSIDVRTSNRAQQRGAHGAFRYFGKLAPDVTGAVLDAASELTGIRSPIVDLMCGSGTTLIEATDRGWAAIGVDVNPVARLFSRVKTQPLDRSRYEDVLDEVLRGRSATAAEVADVFSSTRNAERWFSPEARRSIATLRWNIDDLTPSPEKDALLAALLGRLRRISNASPRTGRLFFDPETAKPAVPEFETAALELLELAPEEPLDVEILASEARASGLPDDCADLVFCHPPYFALYRYSSDVLRFEMEIGGFDRRETNREEVREGWKSGDVGNLDLYVHDMGEVFAEARRIARRRGVLALVVSNSTLGDRQLPVVDRLATVLTETGWDVAQHLEREAHHGAGKYHRSARLDKVVQRDHVLLCCAE